MTSYRPMIIEPVHLLTEVKSQCNSYIIVYLKSIIRNYSIAGKKRGHLACFRRYLITLPYLTLPYLLTVNVCVIKSPIFSFAYVSVFSLDKLIDGLLSQNGCNCLSF